MGLNKKRDVFGDGTAVVPNANCSACHNGQPNILEGFAPSDLDGTKEFQVYADFKYHHIGVPFNREIPGVAKGKKKGLADHVVNTALVAPGFFKTPTLRNVAKGLDAKGKGKAFTHNGYFKSLETLVHFYNTRDKLPPCNIPGNPNPTAEEAMANNPCWPKPEFDNNLAAGKLARRADVVAFPSVISGSPRTKSSRWWPTSRRCPIFLRPRLRRCAGRGYRGGACTIRTTPSGSQPRRSRSLSAQAGFYVRPGF